MSDYERRIHEAAVRLAAVLAEQVDAGHPGRCAMNRWQMKLDVSDVFRGDQPWPERRDEMVRRVRALPISDSELDYIADDLAEAETPEEWDAPWDEFYDLADAYGVWVVTR